VLAVFVAFSLNRLWRGTA